VGRIGVREIEKVTDSRFLLLVLNRSSLPFAQYAMLLCNGFGDVDNGCRYADLATKMYSRSPAREWAARTICTSYAFCFVWKRPLDDLLKPLLEGHETGLVTGDIEVCVSRKK
jgi:predicted ATPase